MKLTKLCYIFLLMLLLIFIRVSFISAINLDISSKPILKEVIADLNEPAVFELIIRNLGETETFEIYSLVGIDLSFENSETPFIMASGESKKIILEIMPQKALKSKKGYLTFEYKIKNSKNEIQKETLTINIIDLKDVFSISAEPLNPGSTFSKIVLKNKVNKSFEDFTIDINSAFFSYKNAFSFFGLEEKELTIEIDKDKLKILNAGSYLINTEINFRKNVAIIESIIKFLEQEGIESLEKKEGFIIRRQEIIKRNIGNINKQIKVEVSKGFFSYLFTTINIAPSKIKSQGLKKIFVWEENLIPNQEVKIIIKTNWLYPILIIILIIIIFILIKKSLERDLILRKKVTFVKTKGGQFALKITLITSAKKFIEKINIIDKIPPLVKLYERFGAISPDKIDLKNKRIEWNIESLTEGEERIFSYIVYSKIGIIGKFELPSAKAIYEKDNKVRETKSNRSFFINEPKNN